MSAARTSRSMAGSAAPRSRSTRCATASTASSSRSSARPASGRSPSRRCATACMCARSRTSSSARCIDHAIQQYGLVVERRRGAGRDRAQSGLPGHRRLVRSPAIPRPACSRRASREAAVRRRHAPRDRRHPAVRRGAHRGPRARVSCATTSSRWRARSGSPRRSTSPTPSSSTCPSPRAEQLNAYFEANKTKFQIPEYRAFSYVLLTVDDVMAQVTVTPEQVKQEYDARSAEFGTPEKRDVDQAMADSEDKAKKIIDAAKAGKSLEDAAKEVLGNADGVIKLGPVPKKDLPPGPLADGVFAAARRASRRRRSSRRSAGTSCASTRSSPARSTPFDEVKDKLEKELKAQLAPDLLIKLVTDFERSLSKTQSMSRLRRRSSTSRSRPIENVDARGQDASGKQVVIGPAPPSWCRPPSPRARAREPAAGDAAAASTSSSAPTASRRPASPPYPRSRPRSPRPGRPRSGASSPTPRSRRRSRRPTAGADLAAIAKELGLELRTTKPVTRYEADHRQLPHPAGDAGAVQAGGRQGRSRCAAPKAA